MTKDGQKQKAVDQKIKDKMKKVEENELYTLMEGVRSKWRKIADKGP